MVEINRWILTDLELAEWRSKQIADAEIRWAKAEDVELLVEFGDEAKVRKGLDLGHRAVVSVRDDRIRGWMWFATGFLDNHDWLRVVLDKEECFVVEILVDPAFRQQGIGRGLAHFAYSELNREGYRTAWGLIDALNQASLQTFKETNLGTGRVFYARLLGLTFLRIGGFMRFGTWGPERRLELRPKFIVSECRNR